MADRIDIKKVVDYWRKSAEHSYETAQFLYKGKHYSDCLFFCHLALEKLLKGLVVKNTKTHAPYIHKLVDLAKLADIKLSDKEEKSLSEITTFNIVARYEDQKFQFYKKCNKPYTFKYYKIFQQLYLWLKEKF